MNDNSCHLLKTMTRRRGDCFTWHPSELRLSNSKYHKWSTLNSTHVLALLWRLDVQDEGGSVPGEAPLLGASWR